MRNLKTPMIKLFDDKRLSSRARNCIRNEFRRLNHVTVGDMAMPHTKNYLLTVPNFGRKSLKEIEDLLINEFGIKMGTSAIRTTICHPASASGLMKRSKAIFDDPHFEQTVGAAIAMEAQERNKWKL